MSPNENKILIYSKLTTNRQTYIFDFIFKEIIGLNYELCNNIKHFKVSGLPKFAYTTNNIGEGTLFLTAHSLLFEKVVEEIPIDIFKQNKQVAFFKSLPGSFFPFDIFAASFYLISRYEEYLPFEPDLHGRFPAKESLAAKHGFLEAPIIDEWSILLKNKLLQHFPYLQFKKRKFRFIPTIDIDNAFAHLHKGFLRTSLSLMQTAIKNPGNLVEKIKVLTKKKKDPYDNYCFLDSVHKKHKLRPIYFILFSKYGKYDKNLSPKNKVFNTLIQKIANQYEIGLHPSYQSNKNFEKLKNEKNTLEIIVGKTISNSRQHFLKLDIPTTYDRLIELDINRDFSMGYAALPGFRAGTCSPFLFFNLSTNKITDLQVVPFALMDVCFKDYLKCSPENALKRIKKIITSIKKVNGLFVSLWHNESLTSKNQQFTWQDVYEGMLNEAKNSN